jgi:glyoxylase-like metal-dependent hydrolase (beta-lactamase superfamily II)
MLSFFGRKLISTDRNFAPVEPDILISEELPLEDFGIDGSVLFTPGHTRGSVSVLLRSSEAFVGDLASSFPHQSVFPMYAEEPERVCESWKKILDFGSKMIFPSHGSSFVAEKLTREYEKRMFNLRARAVRGR